ncbi:hypothetical protein O1611_g4497 [Lasiodiplodia mahajangana]|uniref:Uncharacterized protein n=1 Tax=Lasiodiplodia mahajangana TaxID=1108764 RepID=A0ACC2JPF9_9PEZI|nr:hypothetical protein O1611_g4497 [Lasiodiplodia mahajangana]
MKAQTTTISPKENNSFRGGLFSSTNTDSESDDPSSCYKGNTALRLEQWVADYWIWELASWLLSTVFLASVIVTLSLHQNQPLPEWPFGITINALISILSSLSSSALIVVISSIMEQGGWVALLSAKRPLLQLELYDAASRGPLGSFSFLLQTRLSRVSVGPLIIIASLTTGPFIQQITSVHLTSEAVDTSTLFALVNYPKLNIDDTPLDNPLSYPGIPSLVTAGFYQGLYFRGNLTDPLTRSSLQQRITCSTGNCTYPVFDSLAVCSACANITDHLTMTTDGNLAKWSLPNGFSMNTSTDSYPTIVSTGGKYHPLILHAGLPIVNITAIQPLVDNDNVFYGALAQECMLHWCVNRYASSVVRGVLSENVIDTVKYGYTIDADLLANDRYVFQTNYTSQGAVKTYDKLSVSKWDSASLTAFIALTLTLTVPNYSPAGDNFSTQYIAEVAGPYSTFPGIPLDMVAAFEAMALSLTAAVRSYKHDEGNLRTIRGQAFKTVSVLRVQWSWIALPATLQTTSLCLLCYMAFSTSHQRLPVLKSSILPIVFFGARIRDHLPSPIPNRLIEMKMLANHTDLKQDRDDIRVSA